ncbi:transcriptional regulator, AraC family [Paenibacillus sp. JDR-2]|nr:transcriptional regulator, AraC family [Paenibacillus sp. JDR-2]
MDYFFLSRLARLDVKWVSELQGNEHLQQWKSNPFFELIMITEGPVHLQIGEDKLTLNSGECYLLRSWEQHKGWKPIGDHCGFYWVQFLTDPAPVYQAGIPDPTRPVGPTNNPHPGLQDLRITESSASDYLLLPRRLKAAKRYELLGLFEQLCDRFREPEGYYRYRSSLLLGQILGLIADNWMEQLPVQTDSSPNYLLYRKLVNLLDETYTGDVSSTALEAELLHSYVYLCQIFKKNAGITIGTYVQQLRIQRAKHLLASTNLSVADIAKQCGFEDPFYFSRIFKKIEGLGPSSYRSRTTST